MAQEILLEMIKHTDARAFKRWNGALELEQVKRLMDKYEYRANATNIPSTNKPPQPSVAPEIERPPRSEAASSRHQNKGEPQRQDPKGKGKKGGKSSKYSKGYQPSWQQTNRYARNWQPAAMNMNTHDATFRDGQWTNPRLGRDPAYWGGYNDRDDADENDYIRGRYRTMRQVQLTKYEPLLVVRVSSDEHFIVEQFTKASDYLMKKIY